MPNFLYITPLLIKCQWRSYRICRKQTQSNDASAAALRRWQPFRLTWWCRHEASSHDGLSDPRARGHVTGGKEGSHVLPSSSSRLGFQPFVIEVVVPWWSPFIDGKDAYRLPPSHRSLVLSGIDRKPSWSRPGIEDSDFRMTLQWSLCLQSRIDESAQAFRPSCKYATSRSTYPRSA
jgi:hypothetical protein